MTHTKDLAAVLSRLERGHVARVGAPAGRPASKRRAGGLDPERASLIPGAAGWSLGGKLTAGALLMAVPLGGFAVGVASEHARNPANEARPSNRLTEVAAFDHQVTGVTVSREGRIFVSFPRWTEDAPVSVAEVLSDGSIRPYPDEEWNAWRNAKKGTIPAGDHWVCVQSVVADAQGALWVLDPAAPATAQLVAGGPKLVKVGLASNKVAQIIRFDETVAPQGSYLSDVRFSPNGRHAYITDSGAKGSIVVVDLQTGKARRTLDGHATTQPEKDVVVRTDGQQLRRPDGRKVELASDGIALSPDGRYLYWQALTGKTLYRIPTEALESAQLSSHQLASRVERVGENGVADGLLIDGRGRMYVAALEEDAIKIRDQDGPLTVLVRDERLRWPSTLAEGPDGAIFVTSSRIQDMAWFKPESGPRLMSHLLRVEPFHR